MYRYQLSKEGKWKVVNRMYDQYGNIHDEYRSSSSPVRFDLSELARPLRQPPLLHAAIVLKRDEAIVRALLATDPGAGLTTVPQTTLTSVVTVRWRICQHTVRRTPPAPSNLHEILRACCAGALGCKSRSSW